jgi:hypothetical protein
MKVNKNTNGVITNSDSKNKINVLTQIKGIIFLRKKLKNMEKFDNRVDLDKIIKMYSKFIPDIEKQINENTYNRSK